MITLARRRSRLPPPRKNLSRTHRTRAPICGHCKTPRLPRSAAVTYLVHDHDPGNQRIVMVFPKRHRPAHAPKARAPCPQGAPTPRPKCHYGPSAARRTRERRVPAYAVRPRRAAHTAASRRANHPSLKPQSTGPFSPRVPPKGTLRRLPHDKRIRPLHRRAPEDHPLGTHRLARPPRHPAHSRQPRPPRWRASRTPAPPERPRCHPRLHRSPRLPIPHQEPRPGPQGRHKTPQPAQRQSNVSRVGRLRQARSPNLEPAPRANPATILCAGPGPVARLPRRGEPR